VVPEGRAGAYCRRWAPCSAEERERLPRSIAEPAAAPAQASRVLSSFPLPVQHQSSRQPSCGCAWAEAQPEPRIRRRTCRSAASPHHSLCRTFFLPNPKLENFTLRPGPE
jgi:hypothetical protein